MRPTVPAVLLAIVIAAGACGNDADPVDPAAEAAAVGTYTLMQINGNSLPFKYAQSDTSQYNIVSGFIKLEANHDMTDETITTETRLSNGGEIGEDATQRYLGSWSIRGDSIRLVYPGLGTAMAGLNGASLVLSFKN
jgi:hypothetical protein